MRHIATEARFIEPGDTWSEHDGITYVVYKNDPLGEFSRTIHMIAVKPDQTFTAGTLTVEGTMPFAISRP